MRNKIEINTLEKLKQYKFLSGSMVRRMKEANPIDYYFIVEGQFMKTDEPDEVDRFLAPYSEAQIRRSAFGCWLRLRKESADGREMDRAVEMEPTLHSRGQIWYAYLRLMFKHGTREAGDWAGKELNLCGWG